ncbi:hypothetical protein SDJN02_07760, partial [Cucurbita argyrosperma subsp. argyrosperma]
MGSASVNNFDKRKCSLCLDKGDRLLMRLGTRQMQYTHRGICKFAVYGLLLHSYPQLDNCCEATKLWAYLKNRKKGGEREREFEIGSNRRPSSSSPSNPEKMSSTFSGDETAPFFGFLGAAAALVFSCMGAAYGTAKSGVGVASMGVMRPELVMKSIVPVVMAGVLGIYGLIIAVIISTGINPKAKSYYLFDGYAHLSSGLACGLAGLSAGMAIGIVGDAGVRANAQQPKLFVGMILILIFAEALALYGLIVGIILSSRAGQSRAD